MKDKRYTFQYQDGYDRTITHNVLVAENAPIEEVVELFYDFLMGVYGWDVRSKDVYCCEAGE